MSELEKSKQEKKAARFKKRNNQRRDRDKVALGCDNKQARYKLLRRIAYEYFKLSCGSVCHWCGLTVSFEEFSIEHVEPWRLSANPRELFFSLKNISISHLKCNVKAYNRSDNKNNSKG